MENEFYGGGCSGFNANVSFFLYTVYKMSLYTLDRPTYELEVEKKTVYNIFNVCSLGILPCEKVVDNFDAEYSVRKSLLV